MEFYYVNEVYTKYLRAFEPKIMFNTQDKQEKFTTGVVLSIGAIKYYAPISSVKPYHLTNKLTLIRKFRKTCLPIIAKRFGKDEIVSLSSPTML